VTLGLPLNWQSTFAPDHHYQRGGYLLTMQRSLRIVQGTVVKRCDAGPLVRLLHKAGFFHAAAACAKLCHLPAGADTCEDGLAQ